MQPVIGKRQADTLANAKIPGVVDRAQGADGIMCVVAPNTGGQHDGHERVAAADFQVPLLFRLRLGLGRYGGENQFAGCFKNRCGLNMVSGRCVS